MAPAHSLPCEPLASYKQLYLLFGGAAAGRLTQRSGARALQRYMVIPLSPQSVTNT